MHKKHIFLRVFSKITIFACVFCAFFISPVFATLPAGYTPLEYIESTGTQYIDTGITVLDSDEVKLRACVTVTGSVFMFSQGLSANNRAYQLANTSTGEVVFDIENYNPYRVTSNVSAYNVFRDYHIKNKEFFVDGVSQGVSIGTLTSATETLKLMYNASSSAAQKNKYCYFQVEGKINLIPAKRISDNVVGMYDTVSGQFFTNAGTGSFVAGPVLPTSENPVEVISVGDRVVPAGYTQLEYIESTGTQYINVGKVGNSTYNYKLTYQKTEANNPTAIFGARMGRSYNTGAYFAFSYVTSTEARAVCYFSDYVHDIPYSGSYYENGLDTNKHTFECTPITKIAYIDGNTWQLQSSTTTIEWESTIPLVLFATNTTTTVPTNRQKLKVWEFSAQKPNGDYDFNLIPAKRISDNVVGMYDTVTQTFFTNQGTGDFIAGPEVVIKIATTKFVNDEFAATEAKLATTVQTIESVVSRTIAQTGQIQVLQDTKQTRPDETCPANMKCLLVQDEDGTPHWYPIIEP
ncbi:MAG: hypothetical protein MJ164_02460 [Alphaproteobacteria bacterium]|nr:hypothetical protein [Alphaproteobacteria bacterium]